MHLFRDRANSATALTLTATPPGQDTLVFEVHVK